MKHRERTNNVEYHKYLEGFHPFEFDSIFGVVISWIRRNSHQHMFCHKYAESDLSSPDPGEPYQSLIFEPALDGRTELSDKDGAIRPAPKIPYTVESCERFKHLPHETLLIGGNDQSWHYPLQVTIKHAHSAATRSSDA